MASGQHGRILGLRCRVTSTFATRPFDTDRMPPGIPFIVGNEAAERFSFYGMKAILTVFMTKHLVDSAGLPDTMSADHAKGVFHLFTAVTYLAPAVGALFSDVLWGKYRTIVYLSVGYVLGHAAIAVGDTVFGRLLLEPRQWLYVGLVLIAVGAGGIKPCVSAHVGDQFGERNQDLISRAFSWFYFSINVGATASFLLTPVLLKECGPGVAFGVPGVLMAIALATFWAGRHRFVHIQPAGWHKFWGETIGRDGLRALGNLTLVYVMVAAFWALFDQTGSSWVLQAEQMNRRILGYEILPSQVGAMNPILVLILIPVFTYGVYPFVGRWVAVTPLRKIGAGFFVTTLSFALAAWIQMRIDAGAHPHVAWQFLAYVVLTTAEVMVSITALELSYTQAPRRMKSVVMAAFFMSVFVGNAFTSLVNFAIANQDGTSRLSGAHYFWFFTGVMFLTAVLFVPLALVYRGATFIQGGDGEASSG